MNDKKKKNNKKNYDKSKAVKSTPVKKEQILAEWFFMSKDEIEVGKIKDVIEEISGVEIEVWKEMGVLECNFTDSFYMDMEQIECDLEDEESNAFLQDKQIKSLFAVTIQAETLEVVKPVLEKISTALNGFFCGDTEDFEPMIG